MAEDQELPELLTKYYMGAVERALEGVADPRKIPWLDTLRCHLQFRFAQMKPEERTPVRMAAVIEEMGRPEARAAQFSRGGEAVPDLPAVSANPFMWTGIIIAAILATIAGCGLLAQRFDVLAGVGVVAMLTILCVVVAKYLRTRDAGFIWLGIAFVAWPLVYAVFMRFTWAYLDAHVVSQPSLFNPLPGISLWVPEFTRGELVTLLTHCERLVTFGFALAALLMLYRGCRASRWRSAYGMPGKKC
jgi:hypothetical protein